MLCQNDWCVHAISYKFVRIIKLLYVYTKGFGPILCFYIVWYYPIGSIFLLISFLKAVYLHVQGMQVFQNYVNSLVSFIYLFFLFLFFTPYFSSLWMGQVSFAVDGLLLLASLSILKALLEVFAFPVLICLLDSIYCFLTSRSCHLPAYGNNE